MKLWENEKQNERGLGFEKRNCYNDTHLKVLWYHVRFEKMIDMDWIKVSQPEIEKKYWNVLFCVDGIAEWDPWGVPDDYECEVVENDAPVPKHVPLHRPGPLPEEFYKTLGAVTNGNKKDDSAAVAAAAAAAGPPSTS